MLNGVKIHNALFQLSVVQCICFYAHSNLFFLFFCFKSGLFFAILSIRHAPLSLLFTVVHETGVDRVKFNEAVSWGPGHTLCWCWVWLLRRGLRPWTLNSSYRPLFSNRTAEPFVWAAQLWKRSRKRGRRDAILVRHHANWIIICSAATARLVLCLTRFNSFCLFVCFC